MTTIYKFKEGSHLRGDAQAVGERLDTLRAKRTGLTPDAVVNDARAPHSVLHKFFEWDDGKASDQYRLGQAGHLIRCVTVVVESAGPQAELADVPTKAVTVRAFLPVQRSGGDNVYESTAKALSDAEYRRQVLEKAHTELGTVARKYRELQELAEVIGAIDRVGELLSAERLPS